MPTSLVSTGVQFPDSTIQTTAATGGPNWTTAGTTLAFSTSNATGTYPCQSTTRGLVYASNNATTTDFVIATAIPPEQQINALVSSNENAGSSPQSYPATYPQGATGVGGDTDYAIYPYFVYDGFTGRYSMNTQMNMAGVNYPWVGLAYTTDFINWRPYRNSTTTVTHQLSVFNNYTGTRVYTTRSMVNGTLSYFIYRVVAANAYNITATPTNSIYIDSALGTTDGRCNNLRFVDTGSSGTSYFLATIYTNSASYVAKSTDDGVTWTGLVYVSGNQAGRIVGNNTELMFYAYNQSMRRSTNGGASWSSFDYGSNTQSTSSQYYPTQTAWNGSYWITIFSGRANFKTMGSGTSFTTLTNFPSGVSSQEWASAAWNATLGCWLLVDRYGLVCSNSNSNPSTGTWTVQRITPGCLGVQALQLQLYVTGQTQYNF